MPLCITAGTLAVALALPASQSFTLAWTHSIEKIRWEEDYRVEPDAQGQVLLRLTEARIRGSGAGMEPPDGAQLDAKGVWHYVPRLAPLAVLTITQSPFVAGYQLCRDGSCQPLSALLPGLGDEPAQSVAELRGCR